MMMEFLAAGGPWAAALAGGWVAAELRRMAHWVQDHETRLRALEGGQYVEVGEA